MKKGIIALVVCAMAVLSGFSGCSGTGGSSSSSGNASSDSSSSKASKASGKVVTIRMGGWGDIDKLFAPAVEGMADAIGVQVEFQKYPTDADFWYNLPAQIASKPAPDFISCTNELYLQYIKNGLFVPLDKYVKDGTLKTDKIMDVPLSIWTVDGKLYGLPYTQTPASFIINKDLWQKAGLGDYPKTWEDVLAAARVFKKKMGMTGLCFNTQEFHFTQYVLSFGGGWGEGKTIDSPENAAALQFIIDAYKEGLVVTPKELGLSYDGNVLMQEKAAMSTGGTWYFLDFAENAPDIHLEFLPIPSVVGKNTSGTVHSEATVILKNSAHEAETAKAIGYMYNENYFTKAMKNYAFIPSDKDYFPKYEEIQPNMKNLLSRIEVSKGFGYPVEGKKFADALISLLEEALFNPNSNLTGAKIVKDLQAMFPANK